MNTQPFSITRGQGKTQTIRVELDGAPLNLATASAAQLTITPSALSPAVLLTKTLGAGVAAGAAGYATITLTAADTAAIDSIGSGVWSLLATINGTAVIVARGTVAITGPAQQFVDEGVDQTARDLASAATTAVLAHNGDAAAHGFGVYTVAQLNAFTAANRPTGCVYCSDCLVPEGTGSPVVWSGTRWVCTCSSIVATTDVLTFFRACRAAGWASSTQASGAAFIRPQRFGGTYNSASGGTTMTPGDLATLVYTTGSSATGFCTVSGFNFVTTLKGRATTQIRTAALGVYYASDSYIGNLSTAGDEFATVQGFQDGNSPGATLGTACVAFVYDRGDALGIGNTANSGNLFALCRASSTNTIVNLGAAPSTNRDAADLLEIFATPTNAQFYRGGQLVATSSTIYPSISDSGSGRTLIVKSAGTNNRSIAVADEYVALRR